MTGDTDYRAYTNAISGCGFEANVPYDIYADRVANLTLARNDHSRVQAAVGASQDAFVRLDGPEGAFNVLLAFNQFSSESSPSPPSAAPGWRASSWTTTGSTSRRGQANGL